jgi:hypothetical protein
MNALVYDAYRAQILKEKQQCNQLILELVEDMAKMLDYLEEIKQFAELEILKEAMEGAVPLVDETRQLIIKHYSQDQPSMLYHLTYHNANLMLS